MKYAYMKYAYFGNKQTNKLTQDYFVLQPIKKCENVPVALHECETSLTH